MEQGRNIYLQLLVDFESQKRLALITILNVKGSTPQIPGASAVFTEHGLLRGTIGGGILEADAGRRALQAIKNKKPQLYDFELSENGSSPEGALCGGSVSILIDSDPKRHRQEFVRLKDSLTSREPGLFITEIATPLSPKITIRRHWLESKDFPGNLHRIKFKSLETTAGRVLREGKPALLKSDRARSTGEQKFYFLEPLSPLFRLVIAGAGHIGQALAHLGKLLDFEVTVIDDRPEFANPERFSEADSLIIEDIGRAVARFPCSPDSFIVIVTRGHSHDAEALRGCIHSPAAYIGMIGSKRKVALLRKQSLAKGWARAEDWERVHAPIGLNIGSKTVEEIAVSIAAQLVQVRSRLKGDLDGEVRK